MSTLWNIKTGRTPSGARVSTHRKKKNFQRGSRFLETRIGERRLKVKRARGGNAKRKLLSIEMVNVADQRTGKVSRTKMLTVKSNPANPHYERRNIITKGATVETDLGLAKVTSRTGQDGITNAVLIQEKKPSK
jgi:small subunit ribosomal protein S8e